MPWGGPGTVGSDDVSEDERADWDRRYAEGDYQPRKEPSPLLEEWLGSIPVGRALDVACGAGRNALRLAEAGFDTEGIDISGVAIERARREARRRGLSVAWRVADLDEAEIAPAAYDLVTVFRYVNRPLWPRLRSALAPDGWIIIEHHLQTELEVGGPSTPEFRLAPQELLEAFAALRIISYSELLEPGDQAGSTFALVRLVACNGNPGW